MIVVISSLISLFTLLAAFYQLRLQRIHNERSLRPLGQIIFSDREAEIFVQTRNNGVGPMIIDKVTFTKDGVSSTNIEDCLDLDPRSYMHDIVSAESVQKVILPGSFMEIFKTIFDGHTAEKERDNVIGQLAPLALKVNYRDMYDNKFIIERSFEWFARHGCEKRSLQTV
ncbi:hypothetical protein [Dyadobacter frigoris]|uniref:hypothetical protein n=1 Tax=Dyadobacter frigoris TaxID=2576211 RepID=UPI001E3921EA|nr:hypothetical protein [Dyadobacter frigoris]